MEIYLMRHGVAVATSEWGGTDASRPLSSTGEMQLRTALPQMQRASFSPATILSSPYVRAKQTADILSQGLVIGECHAIPELAAGARIKNYRNALQKFIRKSSLLFVGHMPDLSGVAAFFTDIPALIENGKFEPGEIMAIEGEWGGGEWEAEGLLWQRKVEDWGK